VKSEVQRRYSANRLLSPRIVAEQRFGAGSLAVERPAQSCSAERKERFRIFIDIPLNCAIRASLALVE